jgi:hypothetical protein
MDAVSFARTHEETTMSSDGSSGRRDGFERWVASMKREQQPLQAKPAASKPMDKLELELDENATHVHRIPKDLINRMREQRATEKREAQKQPAPAASKPEPVRAPAPAPEPVHAPQSTPRAPQSTPRAPQSSPQSELAQAFAAGMDDDDVDAALGGVSDDRTAVFRPPPELLARAKRMKAPAKPTPTSELPTKPPPAGALGDVGESGHGMPASRVPAFESVPVKASFPSSVPAAAQATNYASAAALDEPFAPGAPSEPSSGEVSHVSAIREAQPTSAPESERSAVFPQDEATSGVLSVGVSEAPASDEVAADEAPPAKVSDPPLAPIENDALLSALTASAAEPVAETAEEEAPAPTTTSPLVRSERGEAPVEAPRAGSRRFSMVLTVVLAVAAFVVWRMRHGGF